MFAVGLSIGLSFYIQYSNFMMKSIEDKLFNGLFSIHTIVDFSKINSYTKETRYDEVYIENWKKIKSIQENLKLAFIYVLRIQEDGKLYFVIDTGTNPDPKLAKSNTEIDDNFLLHYNDAPLEVMQAVKDRKMVINKNAYTDKWGTFKSAFYPIIINDKVIGVIGADCKIDDIIQLQNKAKITLAIILSVGILVILISSNLIKKLIILPIISLNKGSKEIADGNLSYRILISQKDEIGELANSFNKMATSLKESFDTIQEHNEQLEEKVAKRTEELNSTLKKVQELKNQQDGDYFLTTLITNPLMQNRNKSESVKVDFYLDQKKKFQFKGKTHALGGDINISGNLNFKGTKHTMFFNGDAMGKSMQGAGGALVIGSVLNSIMARSAAKGRVLEISPKEWIRETFLEIQRVMESFDGAMLVSCILGLVNEKTGKVYYFNAEHPFSVLYRDGIASFIEKDISAHKMGMPFNQDVIIFEFTLQPGDSILCGSDGKDDLILNKSQEGIRVINEDEAIFLKHVENSKANLQELFDCLSGYGELSDDLSIVKITFNPTQVIPQEKEVDRIGDLIRDKKYEQALSEIESQSLEDDLISVYRRAICLNKLKRNEEAIEVFDKANEKIREHEKVMRLLARVYFELGNYEESESYLKKLTELFPNDLEIRTNLVKIRSYRKDG
jgi:HAMP domain-containing protein/tetratricopeptide (TPR) repeat protein